MNLDVTHPAGPSGLKDSDSSLSCPTIDKPAGSPAIPSPGTADVLIAARKLIEDPADWCGNGWGRGGNRCAIHAVQEAMGGENPICSPPYLLLESAMDGTGVGSWNDTHSHAEVLQAFDRAIYKALEF